MNSVSITGSNDDLSTGNNSSVVTGSIMGNSDVSVTKVLDTGSPIYSGDEIQYTIVYGNAGPDAADVTITESYPATFTTSYPSSFNVSV